ncbi:MAG: ABC-2 transporter permease [Eubacteriales bacterium]|nr:ABC-2 transporter permease [Eubacteriales bacterium]
MKGLLKSDLYMTKKEMINYYKMFGFFIILSVIMKSAIYVITMQLVITVMHLLNMMLLDENGRDAYYLQMPFSRKKLVAEKYVRAVVFLTPFWACAAVASLLITLIFHLDIGDFIGSCLLGVVYLVFSVDVIIPMAIKRGASRIRLLASIIILLPCTGIVLMASTYAKSVSWINSDTLMNYVMAVLAIAAVILLPASYQLSVKYYQKKEF